MRDAPSLFFSHAQPPGGGAFGPAEAEYRRRVLSQPDHSDAWAVLGALALQSGHPAVAVEWLNRAIRIRAHPVCYVNLGSAYHALGRFDLAVTCYERGLALQSDWAEAYSNLGNALVQQGQRDDAVKAYQQALVLKPDYPAAYNNLGTACAALGDLDAAAGCYQRALALRPNEAEVLNNLGSVREHQQRFEDALFYYRQAQAAQPEYADAHYNESLLLLLRGDFPAGWRKYEWRWRRRGAEASRPFQQPRWVGAGGLEGKTVLLYGEQGLGDTLQFCRYVPDVAERGARVWLEVPPSLTALLSRLPGLSGILSRGEPLPAFDVCCPLLSLPLALGTTLSDLPNHTPYLVPDAAGVRRWRARLGPSRTVKVGLVWAGNPQNAYDRHRSLPLSALAPLLKVEAAFISVQKEVPERDRDLLLSCPTLRHFGDQMTDFAETAALVSQLDLVISVDTAVAHLAGALNKPAWVLLRHPPDWRWLLEREDSPWYPSLRLFRQPKPGDWADVVARVTRELTRFAAARAQAGPTDAG